MTQSPSLGPNATLAQLADDLCKRGVRRIHVLGWRDLDDADAGGSEVHADEFMRRWAGAGLEVTHRTSAAVGLPALATRNGYRVIRRGGRHTVFARTPVSELAQRMGPYDALVEIWNGVPWMSPMWCRKPRITVLHHIHGPMWEQMLPRPLAAFGRTLETRLAPPFYRRTAMVTPSEATREALIGLGFDGARVHAFDNGVDPFWSQGDTPKSATPLVVAVGRFAPVKRFEVTIAAAVAAKHRVPELRLRLIGDGPLRGELLAQIARADAGEWIEVLGHVSRADLRESYREAWIAMSGSLAEGWGLTLTEAAACGTPALATDISGHRCSVLHGTTGVLAEPAALCDELVGLLADHPRLETMARAALERAATLTWEASATGVLSVLHAAVSNT